MSKKGGTDYLEADAPASPDYLTGDGTVAEDVTSLEDYFTKKKPKHKRIIINGKAFHFQSGSPKAKDALLAKHRTDDGLGGTKINETMWRTDAIALTWVTGPGGTRILDSAEKANRFHAEADADEELEMYNLGAAPMLGLKDEKAKDAAEKNSGNGSGTVGLPTSQSGSSELYHESSSPS